MNARAVHVRAVTVLAIINPTQSSRADPPATILRTEVDGFHSDAGVVRCILFAAAAADGYPTKPELATAKLAAPIRNGAAICEFTGVADGTYAVAAFHDENDNGKLDSNFIGIPKEGTAASNGARGSFGPPKFKDAQFVFKGPAQTVHLTVRY